MAVTLTRTRIEPFSWPRPTLRSRFAGTVCPEGEGGPRRDTMCIGATLESPSGSTRLLEVASGRQDARDSGRKDGDMSLFQFWSSWRGRQQRVEELAQQLAAAHWQRVWERLSDSLWQMSRHERRGYIQARGALVIQAAVEQAGRQRSADNLPTTKLYSQVMELVIRQVAEHISGCQTESARTQFAGRRRAA